MSTGLSKVGSMLNVCTMILPCDWMVIGKKMQPGISSDFIRQVYLPFFLDENPHIARPLDHLCVDN